jgi:hypothetical protein
VGGTIVGANGGAAGGMMVGASWADTALIVTSFNFGIIAALAKVSKAIATPLRKFLNKKTDA